MSGRARRQKNTADHDAIGHHVIAISPQSPETAPSRCAFVEDQRRYRSFPQSSSASRFTACAAGFFILSQSGLRPDW
jgi:hypothetical protein